METIHEDNEDQGHPELPKTDTFIPGRHVLGKDEILEPDDSVYEMRHSMQVKWPSLSFDVLRDNLGDQRQRYPATAYIVAGTQAPSAKDNELSVYRMSALHRTQNDGGMSPGHRPLRSGRRSRPRSFTFLFYFQMARIPATTTMRTP